MRLRKIKEMERDTHMGQHASSKANTYHALCVAQRIAASQAHY
jgi:hypothetical protein